jgi:hypothetical protein
MFMIKIRASLSDIYPKNILNLTKSVLQMFILSLQNTQQNTSLLPYSFYTCLNWKGEQAYEQYNHFDLYKNKKYLSFLSILYYFHREMIFAKASGPQKTCMLLNPFQPFQTKRQINWYSRRTILFYS